MDRKEFKARYNEKAAQLGMLEKAECLGISAVDGDAAIMTVKLPGVNIMHFDREGFAAGAIVYAPMTQSGSLDGLMAYAICIDMMMDTTPEQRNKIFDRLHLFDGKQGLRGCARMEGEYTLEVRPNDPQQGLISFALIYGLPKDVHEAFEGILDK